MTSTTTVGVSTPQLGFDFSLAGVTAVGVNKYGATSISDLDMATATGFAAGDALSRMIVDDRVLNMGMTNWRALLDRAVSLGHTELYPSEDGRQGLRTPGLRFGPIHRLPEQGPEYVVQKIFGQRLHTALVAGQPVKSARVAVDDATKVDLVVSEECIRLGLFHGRKAAGTLELALDAIPFSIRGDAGDQAARRELLKAKLEVAFPDNDARHIVQAAEIAFSQILKAFGIGGAK